MLILRDHTQTRVIYQAYHCTTGVAKHYFYFIPLKPNTRPFRCLSHNSPHLDSILLAWHILYYYLRPSPPHHRVRFGPVWPPICPVPRTYCYESAESVRYVFGSSRTRWICREPSVFRYSLLSSCLVIQHEFHATISIPIRPPHLSSGLVIQYEDIGRYPF